MIQLCQLIFQQPLTLFGIGPRMLLIRSWSMIHVALGWCGCHGHRSSVLESLFSWCPLASKTPAVRIECLGNTCLQCFSLHQLVLIQLSLTSVKRTHCIIMCQILSCNPPILWFWGHVVALNLLECYNKISWNDVHSLVDNSLRNDVKIPIFNCTSPLPIW